jgi:ribonuclease HII
VRIAGVDEAGRGPWAGPVVAAAVILHRRRLPVRIDDSKQLTACQRARAFHVIRDYAEIGIGVVDAEAIDRCRIHRASLLAMQQAVHDLPQAPEIVLVDGNLMPSLAVPCWPIPHGDQLSYVIGCASIVAKVVRDRLMAFYHELDPRYHFHRHKGYGTAAHAAALELFGPSLFHRMTFRPVAEVSHGRVSAV